MEIEYRKALEQDIPRIIELWKEFLDKKVSKIMDAAKDEGQKKPITPDEHFDYLDSVAPK